MLYQFIKYSILLFGAQEIYPKTFVSCVASKGTVIWHYTGSMPSTISLPIYLELISSDTRIAAPMPLEV